MDTMAIRTGRTVLVAAVAVLAAACGSAEPEPEPLRPVRVDAVVATGDARVRSFAGSARAGLESRLSFKVPGTIRRLGVNVGDRVRGDQLLAELDPRDFELQVDDAKASLAQARARARNAEATLERVRGLYENDNASQTDYDAARAEYDSAVAQVASLSNKLALVESQLDDTRLRAPVDGAISAVEVEVGENVQPGQTVATLSAGSRVEVQIAVPETFIGRVRPGQPVSVRFDSLPAETFAAAVTEVGVAATGTATTYPVKVRLVEAADEVRPGMAAEVSIEFSAGDGRTRILVPPFAVGEDRDGRHVFVALPGPEPGHAIVHRRPVRVGALTEDGIEIVDGLDEGDLLVTAGVSRLRDGMEVVLPSAEPAR